jgi:aryl-alcohol dehydrogenase-like predicted oxidoreductase
VGKGAIDEIMKRVMEISTKKSAKPAQIAIAWLLSKKEVTAPIIGTSKVEHLEEFVGAMEVKLTEEECRYLEEPYIPEPISGHF